MATKKEPQWVMWKANISPTICNACKSRHGKFYDKNKLAVRPPLHPNCGCMLIPVTSQTQKRLAEAQNTPATTAPPQTERAPETIPNGGVYGRPPSETRTEPPPIAKSNVTQRNSDFSKKLTDYISKIVSRRLQEAIEKSKQSSTEIESDKNNGLPVVPMSYDEIWKNPLSKSNITAEELALVLNTHSRFNSNDVSGSDTWLGDLAPAFIESGEKYGINPVFLASLAVSEGGWARNNEKALHQNNIFGWMGDSKGYGGEFMTFDSYEACIDYVARNMVNLYFTPGGQNSTPSDFDENGNLVGSAWKDTYCGNKDCEDLTYAFFSALRNKVGINGS